MEVHNKFMIIHFLYIEMSGLYFNMWLAYSILYILYRMYTDKYRNMRLTECTQPCITITECDPMDKFVAELSLVQAYLYTY